MNPDHQNRLSPLSYAELLNAIKANDPDFSPTPEESRCLQWDEVFRKIADDTPFKATLARRIPSAQALRENPEWTAEAEKIIALVSALADNEDWGRIQELLNLCLSWQNLWNENSRKTSRKRQTEAANEGRRRLPRIKEELLGFEELLKAAEFSIHPPQGNAHCTNRTLLLSRFYKAHQDEIDEKMRAYQIESDFKKHFQYLFEVYTDLYVSECQSTVSGHVPQKRKPRSAESRERSRQGALQSPKRKKRTAE